MSQLAADRNLLFGILAVQLEFVARDGLVAAMLLGTFPDDGPSLILLARAANAIVQEAAFDPVWELPGK